MERGRLQRLVDSAVNYTHEHRGMATSGGLITGGAAIEAIPVPGKEIVAIPLLLVGGLVGLYSSFVEYYDRVIAPYLPEGSQPELPLANFTEEGAPPS